MPTDAASAIACAMVGFDYSDEARKDGILFWTSDQSVIHDLLNKARLKSIPYDATRYEKCLREHPLFKLK